MPSQAWLWHFAAPLIASALLLASYLPNAHNYFDFVCGTSAGYDVVRAKKAHNDITVSDAYHRLNVKFPGLEPSLDDAL
ncbi:FabD/lysophospholipase-like protein [Stemphylium lycopersici]|nr:FabD/lysophospholipase-like protein [Stemphylium lycopersici]